MVDVQRPQHGPIKVLIVEDTGSWREYVEETLTRHGQRIKIVGLTDNAEDAVEKAIQTLPDVAIVDLKINDFTGTEDPSDPSRPTKKGKHGVSAIRRMRYNHPDVCILVMSQFSKSFGEPVIICALWSGIDGYIRKDDDRFEMRNLPGIVENVFGGYAIFDDNIAQVMMKYIPGTILGDEESEVLSLIADGKKDDEISDDLKLTLQSVRQHRRRILHCWREINYDDMMRQFDNQDLEEIL